MQSRESIVFGYVDELRSFASDSLYGTFNVNIQQYSEEEEDFA